METAWAQIAQNITSTTFYGLKQAMGWRQFNVERDCTGCDCQEVWLPRPAATGSFWIFWLGELLWVWILY